MRPRLSSYIDLTATTLGGQQRLHVGPVHTHLISTKAGILQPYLDFMEYDTKLHDGIVINVGGHTGYAIATATKARAIVNVDLNVLQGVHHKIFADNVLAVSDGMSDFWDRLDAVEPETLDVWLQMLDAQQFEGEGTQRRMAWSLYRNCYWDSLSQNFCYRTDEVLDVIGMNEAALAHNRALAQQGRIYSIVADLGEPKQMQQVISFIDDVAADLGCERHTIRTLPTITYSANALGYMKDKFDFCHRPSNMERFVRTRWHLHDMTFGFHGLNEGLWIDIDEEEGRVKRTRTSWAGTDWLHPPKPKPINPANPNGPQW